MPHNHEHNVSNYNCSFAIGISLNVIFVVIEAGYGFVAGSLALVADAGHNLSDVLSLLMAWGASHLAGKQSTSSRTYGLRRVTILTSLSSAVLLLVAMGGIAWEAVERLGSPASVDAKLVIIVAAIGVVINTATAALFIQGQKQDLNIRAAYLHMAADAGISLGVVVIGGAIMLTGWLWLDPVISLAIVLVILVGTWGLFKESINLSIDAVPRGIDIAAVTHYLEGIDRVSGIHDLHIWALSTTETALTVHLVCSDNAIDNRFLETVHAHLHHHFGIGHVTIQVESETTENNCALNRQQCI